MKMSYQLNIISLISVVFAISLTACTSMTSRRMPAGSVTMAQAYNKAINGTEPLDHIRATVGNADNKSVDYYQYTRTQKNETHAQFKPLANPSIVMYVYPHTVGNGNDLIPVPGYSTIFPLYDHVYYAMPGDENGALHN